MSIDFTATYECWVVCAIPLEMDIVHLEPGQHFSSGCDFSEIFYDEVSAIQRCLKLKPDWSPKKITSSLPPLEIAPLPEPKLDFTFPQT